MKYFVKFIAIIYFLMCFADVKAQGNAEIGVFGGIGWYIGEVNPDKPFYSFSPAYGIIYKYNFNERYALRLEYTRTTLNYSDAKSKSNFQKIRGYSFQNQINDISAQIEFNFMPFENTDKLKYFSPYITLGLTLLPIPGPNGDLQFCIPFAAGYKYQINKHVCLGVEWSMRKTFTDYIDKLPDDHIAVNLAPIQNKQRSFLNNKDWYSFTGFNFTYTFIRKVIDCPAYRY